MNRDKASEIIKIMARIEKVEGYLDFFENRNYPDEFEIHYRGTERLELEQEALDTLIDYYEKELAELNKKLSEL
jgi:hypothetical protein